MEKEKIVEILQRTKDIHWSGFENEVSEAIDSTIAILKRIDVNKMEKIIRSYGNDNLLSYSLSMAEELVDYLQGGKQPDHIVDPNKTIIGNLCDTCKDNDICKGVSIRKTCGAYKAVCECEKKRSRR